jgi:peptidoglycan/LPS O-acetylase OafA/YrhL
VNNLRKLPFLDSLRGWAILLVLLVHSGGTAELFGRKLELANFGQRGVQLFYQVSAFSLLYSHYRRKETAFRAFFLRRFFRIAPLFYLSIAANYVASVLVAKNAPLSPISYASGVLFLFGFHPSTINAVAPAGWSVAVEATFYAVFPVLAALITDLGKALALGALGALACLLICYRMPLLSGLPSEYVQFLWFPAEFPVFCFGFVAFFACRQLVPDQPAQSGQIASLCLLALAACTIYASFPPNNYRLYASSLSFTLLIVALALQPWRIFVNPPLALIGRLSFSIYLVHPYLSEAAGAALNWAEKKMGRELYGSWGGLAIAFAVFLGGSLIISALTYNLVELPAIEWGRKIIENRAWPESAGTRAISRR